MFSLSKVRQLSIKTLQRHLHKLRNPGNAGRLHVCAHAGRIVTPRVRQRVQSVQYIRHEEKTQGRENGVIREA